MKKYRLTLNPEWLAEVEAENEEDAIEELDSTIAINNESASNIFFESIIITEVEDKKYQELDDETDLDLLLEFRQRYWNQWVDYCNEQGYKAKVRK